MSKNRYALFQSVLTDQHIIFGKSSLKKPNNLFRSPRARAKVCKWHLPLENVQPAVVGLKLRVDPLEELHKLEQVAA